MTHDHEYTIKRLRELARAGDLGRLSEAERDVLRPAAYDLACSIVFDVVYRRVARNRGHHACARGFRHLGECCLDGFHDDLEAVVERLLTTTEQINDLEAWIAARAPGFAIDAYRRRRGAIGAPQRPRMTKWLRAALGDDPWLCRLALRIQEWVGVPGGVGATLWPVDSWAGERGISPSEAQADVEKVLVAMRERPKWYHDHIEVPLGHKTAPVGGSPGEGAGEPRPLPPGDPGELDDARADDLATVAVEAIRAGLGRGEDAAATVETVLRELFLHGSGADEIGRAPGAGTEREERVSALLDDPVALEILIERVLRIVRGPAG
ncbi:hypothetical protein [Paractinoplanes lichenicola]|uniref:DUF222 domain-containing protein n=1 Tax=Paractinoplanes lichenicola TaxID=2802976 RepID=A0ABS1W334_9ACTN|nr:hypothetical protein [Actinoplanes lichenicola]MBL7261130.1 hypothetical protein [Actinoplanes lichenicola]